jgi:hypothetical protein
MVRSNWWVGPLVLLVLRLVYSEARTERARISGKQLIFPPSIGARVILGLVLFGAGACTFLSSSREEWWITAGFFAFFLLAIINWPSTVVVSQDSLAQQFWWGRKIRLRWPEITGAERQPGGDILIYGRDGQRVRYSSVSVDLFRFEEEVTHRAGLTHIGRSSDSITIR